MRANGAMIKQMVKVHIIMSMVLGMKAFGKMIFSMDKEKKLGLMDPFIKVNISKERNTDTESTNGMMDLNTKVIGSKIESKALVLTVGWTVECIRENG